MRRALASGLRSTPHGHLSSRDRVLPRPLLATTSSCQWFNVRNFSFIPQTNPLAEDSWTYSVFTDSLSETKSFGETRKPSGTVFVMNQRNLAIQIGYTLQTHEWNSVKWTPPTTVEKCRYWESEHNHTQYDEGRLRGQLCRPQWWNGQALQLATFIVSSLERVHRQSSTYYKQLRTTE